MWFAGPARLAPESGRPGAQRPGFFLKTGMRVGLFGGSFNPAHEGHSHVAQTALQRLGLDKLIWLVSPQNPLKSARDTAPLSQRMGQARAAAHGRAMLVSDVETRFGSRYTIDTLRILKARFPGVHFVWVMGSDSLATFHLWRGWNQILKAVPVAVVSRPGSFRSRFGPAAKRFAHARLSSRSACILPQAKAPAWVYLRGPFHSASSTAIRERLAKANATRFPANS
jgi:nicotinate-nucleotide adenylyltransferase